MLFPAKMLIEAACAMGGLAPAASAVMVVGLAVGGSAVVISCAKKKKKTFFEQVQDDQSKFPDKAMSSEALKESESKGKKAESVR